MAINFVAATEGGGSTASTTLNVPSGTSNGDLMIMFGKGSGPVTPPSGWTFLTSIAGGGVTNYVYYRYASSEPASYSWSATGALRWSCVTYRGVASIDTYSNNGGADTSPTATSLTTSNNNETLLWLSGNGVANVTYTVPSGFSSIRIQSPTSGACSLVVCDATQSTAGASGNKVGTVSSSVGWAVTMIALVPSNSGLISIF